MARLPQPGGDDGQWGEILNDYLSQSHAGDGSFKADTVGAAQLKSQSVTNAALVDGTVQEAKLADGSVTTNKLADNAVSIAKLQGLGQANGIAILDGSSKLPEGQIPDRLSSANLSSEITTSVEDALDTAGLLTGDDVATSVFPSGRRTLMLGDSHTDGAGSSNVTFAYAQYSGRIAGSETVSVIRRGYPGETSAQLLARLPGLITADTPDVIHVLCGTNDVSQGVLSATFLDNIAAMKALADGAHIPFVVSQVPPASSSVVNAATRRLSVTAYNHKLYRWATDNAVTLINTYAAVVDVATGYMASAYDSGDGIHFNDAGHLVLAKAIAPVLAASVKKGPWPVVTKGLGLLPNPLNDSAVGGWTAVAGVPTASYQDPVAGDGLTGGKWYQLAIDNSAGGSSVTAVRAQNVDMSTVDVGDVLVAFFKVKTAGGAKTGVRWLQGSTAIAIPVDGIGVDIPYSGFITARTVTTADKASTFRLGFTVSVAAGINGSTSMGQLEVYNLTKSDMLGLYI